MKFSAVLVATLAASAQAFAPSRPSAVKPLSAATLEAPSTEEAAADSPPTPTAAEPVAAEMAVEKDCPVDQETFVKDSDRVMP